MNVIFNRPPHFSKALFLGLLSLSACEGQPGNDVAYQENSSNCSSEFVADYNKVLSKAKEAKTDFQITEFEGLVSQFEKKYAELIFKTC